MDNHQQGQRTGAALISAERVRGTDVYNRQGERLGDIDSILIDKLSGKVDYVVMSFGGFLGIGERYHPLPWHVLSYDTAQGGYVVDLDRASLEGAPSYDRDETDRFGSADEHRSTVDQYYTHRHQGHADGRSPDYDDNSNRSRDGAGLVGGLAAGSTAMAAGGTGGGSAVGVGGYRGNGEITGSPGGSVDDGSLGTSGHGRGPLASDSDLTRGDVRGVTAEPERHSGGGMGLSTGSDGLGERGVLSSGLGHDDRHDLDRGSDRVNAGEEPVGFYSPEAQAARNETDGDAHRPGATYRDEQDGHRSEIAATGSGNGLRSDGSARTEGEPMGFYSPEAQAMRNAKDGDETGADGRLTVGLPPGGQDREVIDAHQRELDAKHRDDLAALRDKP